MASRLILSAGSSLVTGYFWLVKMNRERAGVRLYRVADFRPDRTGQLLGSAALPERLGSSRLLRLEAEPDGLVAAFIRYTAADGSETVLRSRWIKLDQDLMENVVPWVPYLFANALTVVNKDVVNYQFDQFAGILSLCHLAVNNNATMSL